MKQIVDRILGFLKYDLFANLGYYLLQIFLIVLMLLVFWGINILVRFITDPICIKILRMKENRRGPGLVAFAISLVIAVVVLAISYTALPQLRPTVLGWTGEKAVKLLRWGGTVEIEEFLPPSEKPAPPAEKPKTEQPPATKEKAEESVTKGSSDSEAGPPEREVPAESPGANL